VVPRFQTRVTTVAFEQPHLCIIASGLDHLHIHPHSPLLANQAVIARLRHEVEDIRRGMAEMEGILTVILDRSQLKVVKELPYSWDELLPTILAYLSLRLDAQLAVFKVADPDHRLVFWQNITSPIIRAYEVSADPQDDQSYRQATQCLATQPTDS
jgi:hypothetical protein